MCLDNAKDNAIFIQDVIFYLYHREALKSKHLDYVPIQPGDSVLAALSPLPVTSLHSSEWEKMQEMANLISRKTSPY